MEKADLEPTQPTRTKSPKPFIGSDGAVISAFNEQQAGEAFLPRAFKLGAVGVKHSQDTAATRHSFDPGRLVVVKSPEGKDNR